MLSEAFEAYDDKLQMLKGRAITMRRDRRLYGKLYGYKTFLLP